jgi:hypothetical protein
VDVFLPAGFHELLFAFHGDFLQGFQAVTHKSRGDYGQTGLSFLGKALEFIIGIGLQPWITGQSALKGSTGILFSKAQRIPDQVRGVVTLVPVTGVVGYRIDFAALPVYLAVEAGRV